MSEEEKLAAGVGPARPALVAGPAGDRRLDDDRVARFDPADRLPGFRDDARRIRDPG
ncbi:MAG: hypothetical protein MZV63_41250 [Marinilabiliales bacterium]|nr:hypothetical protein [Marinilabiliales bacterium]